MYTLQRLAAAVTAAVGYSFVLSGADPPADRLVHYETVVVSATRTEVPKFDASQTVVVITSEQIMASPYERVEDIVRHMPGVYNFRHFGLQTNGIVSPLMMRGTGSNRVLLLVDGVPQNDNFNNSIAWVGWGYVPKEAIERIEIVAGPASALYGSDGLGGVIHIITKKPKATPQTSFRAEAGNAATFGGRAFHSQRIGDFGLLVAGGYDRSDGFYMTEQLESYNTKRYRKAGRMLGKATYDLTSSSELSFAALYFDQDAGQGRPHFHNDLQLDQYWLSYKHKGDHFGVGGLMYLNRSDKTAYQDDAANNYASLLREERFKGTYTWGGEFQGTLTHWRSLDLTAGLALKEARWRYDEDYPGSKRDAGGAGNQRFVSPFINAHFKFFDERLLLDLGGRYDRIETFDGSNWDTVASAGKPAYRNEFGQFTQSSFSPKMGASWHPDSVTTLRAAAGKGFRAPSLFELYKVHVRGGGTYYRAANPDLVPEHLWSYDVGIERALRHNLWARFTFYQSFAKNYIGDRLLGTGKISGGKTRYDYRLENISDVNIHGIESEVNWALHPSLSLVGNYTYTISQIKKDKENPAIEGNYLPNNPRHMVHAGVRYHNPRVLLATLTGNGYGKIFFDNENTLKKNHYWTVDLSLERQVAGPMRVYANVENLFNQKYPIFLSPSSGDTIAPGIIVTSGVKFDF
ncbi:MAG: TonB-dependent receptor plug domain-containing protein [Bryobacteraceae bacterium]